MEPLVQQLETLTAGNTPSQVMLETSFLCDALWGQRGEQRAKAQFSLEAIERVGRLTWVRLWVTPAILQETTFAMMKAEMRREARARIQRDVGWQQFKDKHRAEFDDAHAASAGVADEVRLFLEAHGVEEALPRVREDVTTTGRWVAAWMRWYLRHYPIEPADALHLACARVDGTRAIATNDLDLQQIDGFSFVSYRRAP